MSVAATDVFFSSSSLLSTASDHHRRTTTTTRQYSSSIKKPERQRLQKNQVFNGSAVDSFLVSSSLSTNIAQSSVGISRQDAPKIVSTPTKRYVSSFKTLVDSTSGKQTQRLSYVKDSVIIVKLSKENTTEHTSSLSQLSSKHSILSIATSPTLTTPLPKQSSPSPPSLSPILKIEGRKPRDPQHESCLIPTTTTTEIVIPTDSTSNMAMSTTSHPSSNPSLFAYRSTVAGGTTIRQRALAETNTNSLLITSERFKSNMSSSMRPARQPLTATTTMSSAYMSSQQSQRNMNQNLRTRIQQDKLTNSKDLYDYPDPFTNCPQDVLSKLAQLTKLQLETIDWEKKRRFTKKKPLTNGTTQGKDSP